MQLCITLREETKHCTNVVNDHVEVGDGQLHVRCKIDDSTSLPLGVPNQRNLEMARIKDHHGLQDCRKAITPISPLTHRYSVETCRRSCVRTVTERSSDRVEHERAIMRARRREIVIPPFRFGAVEADVFRCAQPTLKNYRFISRYFVKLLRNRHCNSLTNKTQ